MCGEEAMKNLNLKAISNVLMAIAFMFVTSISQATTLTFVNVENNSTLDLSTQLSVDVTTDGTNAFFKILNDVDSGSYASITGIYFGYDSALTSVSFYDDSGTNVQFTDGASPANLPGGTFTADYSADADSGSPLATLKANGVDATGEYITFMAMLSSTFDYSALMDSILYGSFQIGLHVQALTDLDLSDSYEVSKVPVPAAAWLFGTALFGFFATSRRKNNS